MTNDKGQMPNQAQNPNAKGEQFWYLGVRVSFVIGILAFGLAKDRGLSPAFFMSLRAKRGNLLTSEIAEPVPSIGEESCSSQ